jgi:diketogulonate reductase-like aldo/keto reductase
MEFKKLGHTDVRIPEIGIGTWQYQGGPELLRRAVELGAALIDTAEYYGNEEVVGRAIKGIRDQVFVATKANHWRYRDVIASAEASLGKLGVECIDLFQVNWPNAAVPVAETMAAMEDLVDQGKVRYLGVSNFSIGEMHQAQATLRKQKLVSNQLRYSLVERTIERRILPYCQRHQITVLAYSPLAESYRNLTEADSADVLGVLARVLGKTRAQVALNWCIAKAGVVAVTKTESEAHLAEDCGSSGWRLSDEHIRLLDRSIRFRRRSRPEAVLRRLVRSTLQRIRGA